LYLFIYLFTCFINILLYFDPHPHVVPNLYDFHPSVKNKEYFK